MCRIARISSVGVGIVFVICSLQQLFGCANHRGFKATIATDCGNPVLQGGIQDVLEIPRDDVLYPVDSGNGDVKCVAWLGSGDSLMGHQCVSEILDIFGGIQEIDTVNDGQSFCGRCRIACIAFVDHEFGYQQPIFL